MDQVVVRTLLPRVFVAERPGEEPALPELPGIDPEQPLLLHPRTGVFQDNIDPRGGPEEAVEALDEPGHLRVGLVLLHALARRP